jgi:phage terminase small subunit
VSSVQEFLVDKCATRAAIAAGYSRKTARSIGAENLTKPDIAAEIEKGLNAQMEKAKLRAEHVLTEISKIAFVSLADAFAPNGSLLPLKDMPEDLRAALSTIESQDLFSGRGPRRKKIGETKKVKIHGKIEALRLLAQHFNLLTESPEPSPPENVYAPRTPEEIEKIEKRLKELDELREKAGND